jgi:hypothetical protein
LDQLGEGLLDLDMRLRDTIETPRPTQTLQRRFAEPISLAMKKL